MVPFAQLQPLNGDFSSTRYVLKCFTDGQRGVWQGMLVGVYSIDSYHATIQGETVLQPLLEPGRYTVWALFEISAEEQKWLRQRENHSTGNWDTINSRHLSRIRGAVKEQRVVYFDQEGRHVHEQTVSSEVLRARGW